jgi:hypothetical protein
MISRAVIQREAAFVRLAADRIAALNDSEQHDDDGHHQEDVDEAS